MPEDRPTPRELGYYFSIAQVGLELAAFIGLGLVLDHYLGWSPWGVAGGTLLGFVGTLAHLIALVKRQEEENKDRRS